MPGPMYLGRMFQSQLAYYLSISRLWKSEELNFDPRSKHDDMTALPSQHTRVMGTLSYRPTLSCRY